MPELNKFTVDVRDVYKQLTELGYKVSLSEIHGHYTAKGEVWNQRGLRIDVYPFKDDK